MRNKFTFSIFLFLLSTATAFAQTGAIRGQVKTSDGQPAGFVKVGLTGTYKGTVTNARGAFELKNVEAGNYTLTTSFIGLETSQIPVTVQAGEITTVPDILLRETYQTLQEVLITAQEDVQRDSSQYVAKVPLRNLENSQVYSVVDREVLKSQQITSLETAMRNATGVSIVFPATGRATDGGTYYTTRGFTTSSSLINGIAGAVFNNPDAVNIERIEVMKGPSATLFGSSLTSFGGAINIVTKQPHTRTGGSVSLTTGSWGLQRIAADYNTALNSDKSLLFRVNAAYHSQNSFQDYGFTKRLSIAPSLSYRASDRLSFLVTTAFSRIEATLPCWFYADSATTGVTSADQLQIDYNKYYTGGDLYPVTQSANTMVQMNYRLSPQWKSQTVFSASRNESHGPLPYLWFISDTSMTRNIQTYEGTTNQINVQQNFTGDTEVLGMRHRLLAGLDFYQKHDNSTYKWYDMLDTVYTNQPNPNYLDYNRERFNNAAFSYFFASYTGIQQSRRLGAYVSDVVNLTENLLLNAGLRLDRYISNGYADPAADTVIGAYTQTALSPKLGLVWQVLPNNLAVFANYQNSFQNVDGRDFAGKVFIPQRANQVEGGIKASFLKNRLSGTISYYDITVTNSVRQDSEHPTFSKQDGTQRSRGVEAEVNINAWKGLYVMLGFGYNDNKYVAADEDVIGRRPVESGPAQLANAWVTYKVESGNLQGLGIGIGGNYASKKFTQNDTYAGVFYIPSYTVLNSTLFWEKPQYRLSLNVNNLTNERYWVGWNQMAVQNPREIVVSGTLKF